MKSLKKITVLIPCFNEGGSIGDVVKGFADENIRLEGYDLDILVIDNNSNDRTAENAKSAGAVVIKESQKGKGNAMRAGLRHISKDTDYVVMIDGDGTYKPREVLHLIEPIRSGFCNVVVGSRLYGRINKGSMATLNRAGNLFFSFLVRFFYHVNDTDVLSGYIAWKYEAIERLMPHLVSKGFTIDIEIVTKMARLGEEIYSTPISYHMRNGKSNLHPFSDGTQILWMIMKNVFWQRFQRKTAVNNYEVYR